MVTPDKATKHSELKGFSKNWYPDIVKKYPVDQTGDNMIPVPYCVQGGFSPKFIY